MRLPFGSDSDVACEHLYSASAEALIGAPAKLPLRGLSIDRGAELDESTLKALEPARILLDKLAEGPFEIAKPLWDAATEDALLPPFLLARCQHTKRVSGVERLYRAVETWADEFGLHSEWVINAALQALNLWSQEPECLRHRLWQLPSVSVFEGPDLMIEMSGWTPSSPEDFDEYKKTLRREVDSQLRVFLSNLESRARKQHWPLRNVRYETAAYVWTIQRRVLRLPLTKIAEMAGRDYRRVYDAIEGLSSLLALPRKRSNS